MIGIKGIGYQLGETSLSINELAERSLVTSSSETLHKFGFNIIRIAQKENLYSLIKSAAKKALADAKTEPEEITHILFSHALPYQYKKKEVIDNFAYLAPKLQFELNLHNAQVMSIGEQGCSSLFAALEVGQALLNNSDKKHAILCISGDILDDNQNREVLYNVLADGACAAVLSKNSKRNKLLHHQHITKGYYWNPAAVEKELIAAYFPTSQRLINSILSSANIDKEQLDWIVPHNVSLNSWEVLSSLTEIPMEKIWTRNISQIGHCIGADTLINYSDALASGDLKQGQRVLIFTFGFGAHWSGWLIEV